MTRFFASFCLIVFILCASQVRAQAPRLINFQSQIEGLGGETVPITFSIYTAPTNGTQLWSETHNLSAPDGFIRVLLGSQTPLADNLFTNNGERYLQLIVNGETLNPRFQLTSVAYALRAAVADSINGRVLTSLNEATGAVEIVGGDNVSVTRDGQQIILDAEGSMTTGGIQRILGNNGITIANDQGPETTVSITEKGIGSSQIQNNAVGSAELKPDITLGPNGSLEIENGSGDLVGALNTDGAGGSLVLKEDGDDFNAAELSVRSAGNNGLGGQLRLRGNPNWDAIHLFSDGSSQGGRVVLREPNPNNANDSYSTLVLRGEEGAGELITFANNEASIVIGTEKQEIRSRGRVGLGLTEAEFDSEAQLGVTLFVRGDAAITGDLFGGAAVSMSIDHPVDPLNKTLNQATVSSSERLTVYNGNIALDATGEAWVTLPEWFEPLNRDFRYQLTCIGGHAPIYIADKLAGNRFRIAGGTPGLEVSWQITGVRNDPYANQNPLEVESTKPAQIRGSYLHPEAYGVSTGNQ